MSAILDQARQMFDAASKPFFETIALPLVEHLGVPVAPCYPKDKTVHTNLVPSPLTMMSMDPLQIRKWAEAEPFANVCVYAQQIEGGLCFVDKDGAVSLRNKYESETGKTFPKTLLVRSSTVSDGNGGTITKGHWYFRQTAKTIALAGNISEDKTGGLFSFRVKNQYVASIGSIHPKTGLPYAIVENYPVLPMPDDLLDWLLKQQVEKTATTSNVDAAPRNEAGLVPHGSIHGYLLSQAGRLRAMGLDAEEIEAPLLALAHKNCQPPIDESKVKTMAKSICNFAPGTTAQGQRLTMGQPVETPAPDAAPPKLHNVPYPVFPSWVMEGTSIFEGFVKPYCEVNSRIPYFMWLPTAALLLNYVGTKVAVPMRGWKPSFYIVLIGTKDDAHKSSSIKDGMKYLEFAGCLQMYSKEIKNADGKTVVWEAGSPEGLGTDMQRINCKNAVLFYDELAALISKSGIEGSGMTGALLKMYESANFANSVKTKKDAFQVAPDSYVTTLITATTTPKFQELWSQLAGDDTGFTSRWTFVLQPKELPKKELPCVISYADAAEVTKARIAAAINQGTFHFDYGFDGKELLHDCMNDCGGREELRAEKWALYFAIDLGKTTIDNDCITRGIALAEYEKAAKAYLATEEAANKSAGLQQAMVQVLERSPLGRVKERGANGFRTLTGERKFGTYMWNQAFNGLKQDGVLKQDNGDIVLIRSWGEKS